MALGTFTLTGSWKKADGSNASGRIRIEPTYAVVDGVTNNVIVPKVPFEVQLVSGAISKAGVLVISEVDEGYTYTVTELLDGQDGRSYVIAVPDTAASSTLDISDLITESPPGLPAGVTQAALDATLVSELVLAPTPLNATVNDINGIPVNTFAGTGTTVAEWTVGLPSHWATFDIVVRYFSAVTSGNAIVRPDTAFLAVGDAAAVSSGSTATFAASTVTLTMRQGTLASGVTAVADELFTLRFTRLGDDGSDTLAGAIYVSAILLQQAS